MIQVSRVPAGTELACPREVGQEIEYFERLVMVAQIDFKSLPVKLSREAIEEFCRRWKITRLELFGSALRQDFGPDSDLDFLYTFTDDAHWGWEIVTIGDELTQIVGRPVDLVSRRAIERSRNRIRRESILNSARVLYAA
jgi:hypothetical protein